MTDPFEELDTTDLAQVAAGFKETLYRIDSTGKTRVWTIEVSDAGGKGRIHIEAGIKDGAMVPQTTFVHKGKNEGRANATTYMEQAMSEARSKAAKQRKEGYVDNEADMRAAGTLGSGIPSPMLAKTYDRRKKQSASNDLKGYGILGVRVGAQCKFDGVRRFTFINQHGAEMYTRQGDRSTTLPHIEKQLVASFLRLAEVQPKLLETGIWIDGEAYSHAIPFNVINGITRKGAKTDEEKAAQLQIDYHIYDVLSDEGYEERSAILPAFASENVKPVKTDYVIATEDNLRELFEQYVAAGYEGLMIRVLGQPYKQGPTRAKWLLKYKEFEDAEFTIIGAKATVEGDRVGSFTCRMDRPAFDRAGKPIETFEAVPKCSHAEKIWAWNNRDQFMDQRVTVEFFGRSEYGVPRFPRAKGLRYDV